MSYFRWTHLSIAADPIHQLVVELVFWFTEPFSLPFPGCFNPGLDLGRGFSQTVVTQFLIINSRYLDVDLDPKLKRPSNHLLNLRTGFRAEDDLWEAVFWMRNITDQNFWVVGLDVPTHGGYMGIAFPPRTYGVTVRLKF